MGHDPDRLDISSCPWAEIIVRFKIWEPNINNSIVWEITYAQNKKKEKPIQDDDYFKKNHSIVSHMDDTYFPYNDYRM